MLTTADMPVDRGRLLATCNSRHLKEETFFRSSMMQKWQENTHLMGRNRERFRGPEEAHLLSLVEVKNKTKIVEGERER